MLDTIVPVSLGTNGCPEKSGPAQHYVAAPAGSEDPHSEAGQFVIPYEVVCCPGFDLINDTLAEFCHVPYSFVRVVPAALYGSATEAPGRKLRRAMGYAFRCSIPEKPNNQSMLEGSGVEKEAMA
jgi:hypothetical protein